MSGIQDEIYKAIDILTDKKIGNLKFDKTRVGKIININDDKCTVLIDGEEYICTYNVKVEENDIVRVKFPQNNNVNKYVESVVGEMVMGELFYNIDGGKADTNYGGIEPIIGGDAYGG